MISANDNIKFLHPVGMFTLRYGVTIPLEAQTERPPIYSGMMSYEKAARELPYLGFMFEMPIVEAGVRVTGDKGCATVTLS